VRALSSADLARVVTFTGLIAALGLTPALAVPGVPVPVTAQTLGVMLAGALLGARRGALAVTLFLVLVAVGLPLLSGGRGGLGVFAGPSAGYLIGWVPGALVVGWLMERRPRGAGFWYALGATLIGGVAVVYLVGVPVQAWRTDTPPLVALGQAAVFLPGDVVKAVVAAAVAVAVHRALPELLPPRDRATVASP
jgi:biotin transport system substrate-specific component